MPRLPLLLAAACAAALATPAAAAAMIQVDRGIAGARLDNTRAEVRAALGRPASTRSGKNPFGRFVEWRFRGGIRVLFQGGRRVTSVSTTGLGDRTRRGVGVRSSERAVRRRVAGVRCEDFGDVRSCHTGEFKPGRRITDFLIRGGRVTRVTVGYVID
jgi:opacity protein-like surface antigen